jgi:hypothetical protein
LKQKENKKLCETIRKIVKKRNMGCMVKPLTWVSHFQELFTKDKHENLVTEPEIMGPQYLEELDRHLTTKDNRI